jgi:phage terminase large subunit-like protein
MRRRRLGVTKILSERGALRLDAWEQYAAGTRGEHFEWWAAENLVLGQSRFQGTAMVLERDWQAPIMYEALAVDDLGYPFWRTVVIILPRKNAKTNTLGAYADYQLDTGEGEPEILMAAGSNFQAGKLYDAASGFIRRSADLRSRLIVRQHVGEIARRDGGGKIIRLSSEGETQQGANPSLVVCDELAWWRAPRLRRLWGALTTAGGARVEAQLFAITTEAEASGRAESILGAMVDGNERRGDLERMPGVTISRDKDSRTIVFRFHAVDAVAADPRPLRKVHEQLQKAPTKKLDAERRRLERALLASVMPANRASWITDGYILGQALAPDVMPSDFLQLHANVAADMQERWIGAETWAGLQVTPAMCDLQDGDSIAAAVDAALSHDSTAVTWGHKLDDGRVCIHMHSWCARQGVACHEFVEGGRIRNEPVKDWLRLLAGKYHLAVAAYDPKYFGDAAMELSDEGLLMKEIAQQGREMREAENQFHTAVLEGMVAHTGDAVLAEHVAATIAEKTDFGWRIRKLKNTLVIDGLVSAVMTHSETRRLDAGRWDGPLVEALA